MAGADAVAGDDDWGAGRRHTVGEFLAFPDVDVWVAAALSGLLYLSGLQNTMIRARRAQDTPHGQVLSQHS